MKSFNKDIIKNRDFEDLYIRLSSSHHPIRTELTDEYFILLGEFNVIFQKLQRSVSSFVYLTLDISDNRFGEIVYA